MSNQTRTTVKNVRRHLSLSLAMAYSPKIEASSEFFQSIVSLIVSHAGDTHTVTRYPAKIIALKDAFPAYGTARFLIHIPEGVLPPVSHVCAVQVYDKKYIAKTNEIDTETVGLFGCVPTETSYSQSISGAWLEMEVHVMNPDSFEKLGKQFTYGQEKGHFDSVSMNQEVIHEAKNMYGDVVARCYGPKTITGSVSAAFKNWMKKHATVFSRMKFYAATHYTDKEQDKIAELHGKSLMGTIEDQAAFVDLLEKYEMPKVFARLDQQYEISEIERMQKERKKLEEAFSRSTERKRRIVISKLPFSENS